jgi:origin recognition complex subunit 1
MTPSKKPSRAEKARSRLTGAGAIVREDSDDELGYVDHPWTWIYAQQDEEIGGSAGSHSRRKAQQFTNDASIVGARMGGFQCHLGDTVLLQAAHGQAWVGIIQEFFEDEDNEDEKMAKFLWFNSPLEIRSKSKRLPDTLDVR